MNIIQFKQSRAADLKAVAASIEKALGGGVNTSPILVAASRIERKVPIPKSKVLNPNFWGYEIIDFQIPVDTVKHIRPKGIIGQKVELTLNMKMIADFTQWDTMNDPFIELNFQVVIRGISETGEHYLVFHVDRHDMSCTLDEPHPVYHIQYSNNPFNQPDFNYGSTLMIDTPRILHYPIDFILGIGFLTSNFFPIAFDLLLNDGYFNSLYRKYQEKIVRPYVHTMASYWDFDKSLVTWSPKSDLCPFII